MSDPTPEPTTPSPVPQRVRPVDLRDYVDFSSDEARRVRVYATDRLALDLWCLEPGQTTHALTLGQDVTYTVIGGRSWFVTEEGEVGLDPMGAMLVPAGLAHGFENRAADPLIVVATQAPPNVDPIEPPVTEQRAAVRPEPQPGVLRRVLDGVLGPRSHD